MRNYQAFFKDVCDISGSLVGLHFQWKSLGYVYEDLESCKRDMPLPGESRLETTNTASLFACVYWRYKSVGPYHRVDSNSQRALFSCLGIEYRTCHAGSGFEPFCQSLFTIIPIFLPEIDLT
jgi:hypothetical protein